MRRVALALSTLVVLALASGTALAQSKSYSATKAAQTAAKTQANLKTVAPSGHYPHHHHVHYAYRAPLLINPPIYYVPGPFRMPTVYVPGSYYPYIVR